MQTSCPHCGQNYQVSAELLGSQVQCSTCSKPFNIPASQAAAQPAASQPAASQPATTDGPIEVACSHCDSRFQAPAQLAGTTANCATCQQPFVVKAVQTEFNLAPADDALDPFGGLAGDDPLGAALGGGASGLSGGGSSPLGGGSSPLGGGLSSSGSYNSSSSSSSSGDNSALWIGVAKILGGILMGLFGVVATMASWDAANEGESYTVYTGLVIGGVALVGYGAYDIYSNFSDE